MAEVRFVEATRIDQHLAQRVQCFAAPHVRIRDTGIDDRERIACQRFGLIEMAKASVRAR